MHQIFSFNNYYFEVILRILLATVIGAVIGMERSNRGKDAGIRTHVLVCLGAALTSLTSMYVSQVLHIDGDVFRISAQVISGIGFLGAGMIFVYSNQAITNLTTAAGIWITGSIGVALGYGFYIGAVAVSVVSLIIIMFSQKLEKTKKINSYYMEIYDMSKSNEVIDLLKTEYGEDIGIKIIEPISKSNGHIGILFYVNKKVNIDIDKLLKNTNILYICKEKN